MKIVIGVPGSGTSVEIEIPDGSPHATVKEMVVDALGLLKLSGDTWVEWSRENETPEQTETRELIEKNSALKKRALAAENTQLEELLAGGTDGIHSGDM